MDRRQPPTLEEILDLFHGCACPLWCDELYTGDLPRWLIAQVPEANSMWKRLCEEPAEHPAAIELSRLVFAARCPGTYPQAHTTARWLIERIDALRENDRKLRQMQDDVGKRHYETEVFKAHRRFEEILRDLDRSPTDFQLEDQLRYLSDDVQEFFDICVARLMRAESKEALRLRAFKAHLESYLLSRKRRKGCKSSRL